MTFKKFQDEKIYAELDVGYKGKKIEKTLLTSGYIIDVSDKEMKVVNINGSRYYIEDKEDEITVVHQLISQGYTVSQIAQIMGVTQKTVKKYMSDCW
jgi:DNA-binding NarL/FixJ family response regulator